MLPEMPVIYENPRFDAATPTLKPIFDRALRAGLVLMLEWGTLTLMESAPPYLKWATVVIAILGLSVHESWPWLHMRDRRWYPSLMGILVLSFIGIAGYAVITEPPPHHTSAPLAAGPVVQPPAIVERKLTKNYFPAEKVALGNLLAELSSKLNNDGLTVAGQAHSYGAEVSVQRDELTKFIARVNETIQSMNTFYSDVGTIISKDTKYRGDLLEIAQPFISGNNPAARLQQSLNDFSRELTIFLRNYDTFNDENRRWISYDLLRQYGQQAERASDEVRGWIAQTNFRIDAPRELLR